MALSKEQFKKALDAGFTVDEIASFENTRVGSAQKSTTSGPEGEIEIALSKAQEFRAEPSNLEFALTKTKNQIRNIVNEGLLGIPEKISPEIFAPRGLTPEERIKTGLMGGTVIGGAIIDKAVKGIKWAYALPSVRKGDFLSKAVKDIRKIFKAPKKFLKSKQTLQMGDDQLASALDAINKNRDSISYIDEIGRLPNNVDEAIAAASQTKEAIFKQYTSLRKLAGDKVMLDIQPALSGIKKSVNTLASKVASPHARKYAIKEADRISKLSKNGKMSLDDVDDIIREYNARLGPFYERTVGNVKEISKLHVDAKISNLLRKELDKAVSSSTGNSYQVLKNRYGAVADLEKSLVKKLAAMVAKSDAPKVGALDTVPILYGSFTGNKPLVAAGILQKGVKGAIARLNDPNFLIKKAFSQVGKSGSPTFLQMLIDQPLKGTAVFTGREILRQPEKQIRRENERDN